MTFQSSLFKLTGRQSSNINSDNIGMDKALVTQGFLRNVNFLYRAQ